MDTGTMVTYRHMEELVQIPATWLIGADGKRGAVRKTYLEKTADIRQVYDAYRYEGTWVAANLKLTLPTPESHPDLATWKLGMTAEEVYDLFWPQGWHFCSPPGKPTASGRFGPHEARMWRHEFEERDCTEEESVNLLWDHLTPMITHTTDSQGVSFGESVTFPFDCIEILRCRPFTFTHKIVNKWFHGRNILIGDAAHVFPPFGGQGIASGVRDAHQLAWRLALLEKLPQKPPHVIDRVLSAWARERTHSVHDAVALTKANGMLANTCGAWFMASIMSMLRKASTFCGPSWKLRFDPQLAAEYHGYQHVVGGFFLPAHGGGRRIPQL